MSQTLTGPGARRAARAFPWPLLVILAVQVALAIPLITSSEIFSDEGLYLYAGHQMLAHWVHGVPVQDFQTYFSGSPAIYPPLAALADHFGGLAGARTLSLVFILATTVLLYATTVRLFSRSAGYLAALLFASLGGTQFLAALATYDTVSLFLLAAAVYLAVSSGYREGLSASMRAFVASPLLVALANAAKYASALWDPIVIAVIAVAPLLGGERARPAWRHAARYTAVLATALGAGLLIGNAKYWRGIMDTTVARTPQQIGVPTPAGIVLHLVWAWIGVVVVLAAVGLLLVLARPHPHRAPMGVVAAALLAGCVLAPLNQARIETSVSLQKHVVFGAWFGCILAGHAIASLATSPLPARARRVRLAVLAAVFAAAAATVPAAYATQVPQWHQWSAENPAFITALKRYTVPGAGRYLIEGHMDITAYYVGDVTSLQWKEAGGDGYDYTDPATGQSVTGDAAYQQAVAARVFTLIILDGGEPTDTVIEAAISADADYHVIAHLPPSSTNSSAAYTVWALNPGGNP
jgi:4-amino-4-deoxy-L-arabinose transferase-like glycosyltransferase